jgi:endonuclease/exonuclease/phosphatase family metal-dependent hydrolase
VELDPKFRLRPWQAALLAVLVVTGLVFVFVPELPLLGASSSPPASSPPSPSTVVPSDGNTHAPDAQETIRPAGPLVPDVLAPTRPGSRPATTCVPQGSDITLSVLSFNTHSAQGRGGVEMEQIAREIASWDPDIVLLQEVDRNRASSRRTDQPGYYAQQLGMEMAFGVNVLHQGNGEYGVATLSKYPIVATSNTHLPNDPSLPKAQLRGILNTQIKVEDTTISVYNTHLQHIYDDLRLRQMHVVTDILAADPLPTIMGGDLNSGPNTPVLAAVGGVLRDSWPASGVGPGSTVPAANPTGRIDYVLYSDPLVPVESRVFYSQISDHRAVRSTFTLSDEAEPICVPVFDEPLQ